MAIDIYNEGELNKYITDIIYSGDMLPDIKKEGLKKVDYVKCNQDNIAKGMVSQWMKLRLRQFLSENDGCVASMKQSNDLQEWAQYKLARGGKIFIFNSAKVSQELRNNIILVKKYLYDVAYKKMSNKIAIAEKSDKIRQRNTVLNGRVIKRKETENLGIKLDDLKNWGQFETFEKALKCAIQWQITEIENKRIKAEEEKLRTKSEQGTKVKTKFHDGFSVVRLLTPEALRYEASQMGHCLGDGNYDDDVKSGKIEIYSIRDMGNNPHVTIEVQNNQVFQCKGKEDKAPVDKYIPYVQSFIEENQYDIKDDIQNIGLIKDINGQYYNIYKLPKEGIEIDNSVDLTFIDMTNIDILKIKTKLQIDLSDTSNILSREQLSRVEKINNESFILKDDNDNLLLEIRIVGEKWKRKCTGKSSQRNIDNRIDVIEINGDLLDIGLMQDEKGKLHNIYDLPDEGIHVSGDFCLFMKDIKKINLDKINVTGIFSIAYPDELPESLDLSRFKDVNLSGENIETCDIKGPKRSLIIENADFIKSLDVSQTQSVEIRNSYIHGMEKIILPPKKLYDEAKYKWVKNLPDDIKSRVIHAESNEDKNALTVKILKEIQVNVR